MEFKQVRGIGYNTDDVDFLINDLRVRWKDGDLISLQPINFPKFRKEKLGYSIPQVDAVLKVMTKEVTKQNKVKIICKSGLAGWDQYLVQQKRELLGILEDNVGTKFPVAESEEGGYSNKSVDKAFAALASSLRNKPQSIKLKKLEKTSFYWTKKMNASYNNKNVDQFLAKLSNYLVATSV